MTLVPGAFLYCLCTKPVLTVGRGTHKSISLFWLPASKDHVFESCQPMLAFHVCPAVAGDTLQEPATCGCGELSFVRSSLSKHRKWKRAGFYSWRKPSTLHERNCKWRHHRSESGEVVTHDEESPSEVTDSSRAISSKVCFRLLWGMLFCEMFMHSCMSESLNGSNLKYLVKVVLLISLQK